jgi:uncharacterized coiled-coil DUF342 family protein
MEMPDFIKKREVSNWFDDEFNRRIKSYTAEITGLKRDLAQTVDVLQTVREELKQAQHEIVNLQKQAKRS